MACLGCRRCSLPAAASLAHTKTARPPIPLPFSGAGSAAAKLVLENVELPGWLFQGELPAPEVQAAEAVVAAEQEAAPPAQPEEQEQQAEDAAAAQPSQQAETAEVAAEAAAVEEEPQVQAAADAMEVEPAAEQEQQEAQQDPAPGALACLPAACGFASGNISPALHSCDPASGCGCIPGNTQQLPTSPHHPCRAC